MCHRQVWDYVLLVVKARKHLTISKSGLKVYLLESAELRLTIGKHGKIREEKSSASPGKHASFRKCGNNFLIANLPNFEFLLTRFFLPQKNPKNVRPHISNSI